MKKISELKDFEFSIYGTKWKVKFVDNIVTEDGSYDLGLCDPLNSTILIRTKKDSSIPLPIQEIELTFFHELIHAILMTGQYLDYYLNENLVEWLAKTIRELTNKKIWLTFR